MSANIRIEPDLLELTTISFFLDGEDMPQFIHCSSWIFNTVSENFIQEQFNANESQNFEKACRTEQYQIVQLMIAKGANVFNGGLYEACRFGNLELAQLMLAKGTNDFNYGLYAACYFGSSELAQLMIAKGANDFNRGLHIACYSGKLEFAQLMIANDFNYGLRIACRFKNLELIQLLLAKGANSEILNNYPEIKQKLSCN